MWMPVPGRPDRTMFYWHHYSLDDEKFGRRNEIWLDEQVDREDIEAIGEVAKGVRSGFAPRGRFIPGDEAGPHWFHRLVFESIFPGKVRFFRILGFCRLARRFQWRAARRGAV